MLNSPLKKHLNPCTHLYNKLFTRFHSNTADSNKHFPLSLSEKRHTPVTAKAFKLKLMLLKLSIENHFDSKGRI